MSLLLTFAPCSCYVRVRNLQAGSLDTWRTVGLANDRYIHGANISGSLYGKFYRTDNTVGVLLDMDHGTLSFILNAYGGHTLDRDAVVNMGIAQSNLGKLVG